MTKGQFKMADQIAIKRSFIGQFCENLFAHFFVSDEMRILSYYLLQSPPVLFVADVQGQYVRPYYAGRT